MTVLTMYGVWMMCLIFGFPFQGILKKKRPRMMFDDKAQVQRLKDLLQAFWMTEITIILSLKCRLHSVGQPQCMQHKFVQALSQE